MPTEDKPNKNLYSELYSKLNPEQKQAVDTLDGPVLVLAGPGTGKTQVLTMRIANILQKTDTDPSAILALTFTESGVRAMKERLLSIIGTPAYYVGIYTFHSFASEIIRTNPDEFAMSAELEPLSDLERVHIFKEIFDELKVKNIKPFNAPYLYLRDATSKIRDLKREGIDCDEYEKFINEAEDTMEEKDLLRNRDLLEVYRAYQEKLRKYGRYDFEDMINFVLDAFKNSTDLLRKYQERFQYFLVDEFQDTNSAQAELLYLLSEYWKDEANLFVVGDDDQSIYRFQGASLENIVQFNDKYPNASKIALKVNYRSYQSILDVSQSVISNNKLRISNKIDVSKAQLAHASQKDSKPIIYGDFSSSYTENYYIATKIKELIESGTAPNEIAVIYRNNRDSGDIADMLSRFNIEYVIEGGENVLQSGIITRLLHLLRTIHFIQTKNEDLDLFTLLNYEFTGIAPLDILKLSRFASARKINLFEALTHADIAQANIGDLESLNDFFNKLVRWNQTGANVTLIELLEIILNESGYLNWILNQPASFEYLNKLNSFLTEVKRLNYSNHELKLGDLLRYLDLMKENGISIDEESLDIEVQAVHLTTAHKSKGLEFEHVFIPKFVDKKWSNAVTRELIKLPYTILQSKEKTDDKIEKLWQIEDERRLFFVTLTRAKKKIYITKANTYAFDSASKGSVPGMFLHEIPSETCENLQVSIYEKSASEILRQLFKPKIHNTTASSEEKSFLSFALRNFKLSASTLNSYRECGYRFKLEQLFKVPKQKERALLLGSLVHTALEKYYRHIKSTNSSSLDKLLTEFKLAAQAEILSKKELEEILSEGEPILKVYYDTYGKDQATNNIVTLEKFFGRGISKTILDGKYILFGKVDKIELEDRETKTVKIVDYKTGKPKTRNEILGKTKYSNGEHYNQLLFYKLLVDLDRSFNYKVGSVELDYIGDRNNKPKREVFSITEQEVENFKQVIRDVADSIAALKFEKTGDYTICASCKFRDHCWPDGTPDRVLEQLTLLP